MYSIANHSKSSKPQPITKKTLDVQHSLRMQQFYDTDKQIQELQDKITSLKDDYESLSRKKSASSDPCEEIIDDMISLQDNIMVLEQEMRVLGCYANEIDYLTNTGDILFKYYDIIDKGTPPDESLLINKKKVGCNSILKYLVKADAQDGNMSNNDTEDRATLLEKYMTFTESNYVKTMECENKDKCHFCDSSNRNIMLNDGLIYCNECNTVEYIIIDHDRPSYKDPPKEVSYFSYKRKMIDALKSHTPRQSEYVSWENVFDLRMILISSLKWLVAL